MNRIHLVVVGRNNVKFARMNIGGIFGQDTDKITRVTWIDDASIDGTVLSLGHIVRNPPPNVTCQMNTKRLGGLANLLSAVNDSDDDEIIVHWDADDFFASPFVLERIAREYEDPNCWMTYGGYLTWPSFRVGIKGPYPLNVIANNSFRESAWVCEPPRSFRAGLAKKVPVPHLMDDRHDGSMISYYESAWDFALYISMLELAGEHSRYIPDVLYLYNERNPASDWVARPQEQQDNGNRIRTLPRLTPLVTLK
jgi:glycosyltransferase involved in cell wall biosynthesis